MTLLFDARVLTHKSYTGVENYTKNILEHIEGKLSINKAKPKTLNKYIAHLWTHFILPLKKGDVLFSPANIAPIFVPKSKKLVLTIHDVAFLTYPDSFSKFFRLYYKFLIPFGIKRADSIITVSNYSKELIEKYYPQAKGKVNAIHLGVDSSFRVLGDEKKEQILYVGSLNERKNFIGVIEAFERLSTKCKLILVGNYGDNFELDKRSKEVLKRAKEHPNIEFKSNVSDDELIELYNFSKLFVYPSFYEGFGLPVLEAMACGTPVVTSDVSSLPEVGGDAVVYYNPNDINDIKDKIEMVLDDENLQEELRQKGLQRAKEFSWEQSALEHIKVFESLI